MLPPHPWKEFTNSFQPELDEPERMIRRMERKFHWMRLRRRYWRQIKEDGPMAIRMLLAAFLVAVALIAAAYLVYEAASHLASLYNLLLNGR